MLNVPFTYAEGPVGRPEGDSSTRPGSVTQLVRGLLAEQPAARLRTIDDQSFATDDRPGVAVLGD